MLLLVLFLSSHLRLASFHLLLEHLMVGLLVLLGVYLLLLLLLLLLVLHVREEVLAGLVKIVLLRARAAVDLGRLHPASLPI